MSAAKAMEAVSMMTAAMATIEAMVAAMGDGGVMTTAAMAAAMSNV